MITASTICFLLQQAAISLSLLVPQNQKRLTNYAFLNYRVKNKVSVLSTNNIHALKMSENDEELFLSLQKRQKELLQEERKLDERWSTASCDSSVKLVLDDWIRRVSVTKWPYIGLGSSSGGIYIGNLATGDIISSSLNAHNATGGDPSALSFLNGMYDGGGVIALVFDGSEILVSAGREGGVKAWRFVDKKQLLFNGNILSLKDVFVTSLLLQSNSDNQYLWVGCFSSNNNVQRFDVRSKTMPLQLQKPSIVAQVDSPVICMCLSEELDLLVCGTTRGYVYLISTRNGAILDSWQPFKQAHVRSVTFLTQQNSSCVVCGGANGQMKIHFIIGSDHFDISFDKSIESTELVPSHSGPGNIFFNLFSRFVRPNPSLPISTPGRPASIDN